MSFACRATKVRFSYVVMYAAFFFNHVESHVEAMEKDAGHPQGDLRDVENDAGLVYEIDALSSSQPLLRQRKLPFYYAGRARHFVCSEVPLVGSRLRRSRLWRSLWARLCRRRCATARVRPGRRGSRRVSRRRRNGRRNIASPRGGFREPIYNCRRRFRGKRWRLVTLARRTVSIDVRHLEDATDAKLLCVFLPFRQSG